MQVWIPQGAVRRAGDANVVYVLRGDRVAEAVVEIGPELKGEVQILAGLGPGERVVVGEVPGLAPGKRVRVKSE
jgi:hypothetical protein